MDFRVDIAGETNDYHFNKNEIIIGSHASCDIFLDYEAISEKHLRVFEIAGILYFDILSNEFETFLDDKIVSSPSKNIFNKNAAIEIGGIYIFNISKDVTSKDNKFNITFEEKTDNPIDKLAELENIKSIGPELAELDSELSSFQEATVSDLNELEQSLMQDDSDDLSEEEKRKKYRPELYSGKSLETKEFKLKKEDVNLVDKKNLKKQKIEDTKSNVQVKNKRKRTRTRVKKEYVGHKFSLTTILVVCICLAVAGGFYYKKFYLPSLNKIQANVDNDKTADRFRLATTEKQKILERNADYKLYANTKKCQAEEISNLCSSFNRDLFKLPQEGIVLVDRTAYVGISRVRYEKNIDELFKYTPEDLEKLKPYYEENYSKYKSWEQFKQSDYKLDVNQLQFYKDKHFFSLLIMNLLFKQKIKVDEGIEKINFFLFDLFGSEIQIINFFEFTRNAYIVKSDEFDHYHFKTKTYWNSYLTNDLESLIRKMGTTLEINFDDTEVKEEFKQELISNVSDYLNVDKCSTQLGEQVCNTISSYRERRSYEGIVQKDDKLFFIIDLDMLKNWLQQKYHEPLNKRDDIRLAQLLKRLNADQNDFVKILKMGQNFNADPKVIDRNFLFASLLLANLNDLFKNTEYSTMTLMGVASTGDGPYLINLLTYEKNNIVRFLNEKSISIAEQDVKFLTKKNIPIFDSQIGSAVVATDF